jgi:hypothetical protein
MPLPAASNTSATSCAAYLSHLPPPPPPLLLQANLFVNSTTPAPSGLQDDIVIGSQITTASDPMRVLFLPHVQYQRFCEDATMKDAVVGHCRMRDVQNFKTPQMKQQVMKSMGLWKKGAWDTVV